MPSTCSKKPWTKCCRDCSPSPITSSPASSCALIHSNVASALACLSSSPSAFHCGQSLLVSDSQAGLGKLPAIAVLKSCVVMVLCLVVIKGNYRNSCASISYDRRCAAESCAQVITTSSSTPRDSASARNLVATCGPLPTSAFARN